MSALLFLTGADFKRVNSAGKDIMITGIKGFSLILFYSNACEACKPFVSLFSTLPNMIKGCTFGICNVSHFLQEIKAKSVGTDTQLEYVPYIVFYTNGKPCYEYQGNAVLRDISLFVSDLAKHYSEKMMKGQVNSQGAQVHSRENTIPAYTIGRPLYGKKDKGVCYLSETKAYKPGQAPAPMIRRE